MFNWLGHIIRSMTKGCGVLALLSGVLTLAGTYLATNKFPHGWTLTMLFAIMIISGLLGAVGALAWRLSHIGELVHVVEEVTDHGGHVHK
ncbi:MAG TPA: hypothetical protein VF120_00375 [Ktedonobacterales bacterium]